MNHSRQFAVVVGVILFGLVMNSCSGSPVAAHQGAATATLVSPYPAASQSTETNPVQTDPSEPLIPTITPGPTSTWQFTPTALPTHYQPKCDAADWQSMPVVPNYVSAEMVKVYQDGLAAGNNPHAISVVGDCQNVPSVFLGHFDNLDDYSLGEQYAYLQETIDWFKGSFSRHSLAVSGGYNVAAVLSVLQSDPDQCQPKEDPLDCELRINKPSIVIVSMETWWSKQPADVYEKYMRQILDTVIAHGAVPIIATKADNLEGDYSIDQTIANLACEYQIPLWNFWAAANPLPNHGLWTDGFHLTVGQDMFDDPQQMLDARPVRNLTGLQSLDFVWKTLNAQ